MTVYFRPFITASLYFFIALFGSVAAAVEATEEGNPLATIALRPIGPAITSGRISDFAFYPGRNEEFYVATASGGLWKTDNDTITWTPLFDTQGSFAIGCVTLDPNDPKIVWVGTGENNSQRSVAYGDGVYKSIDGGKSWENMGFKDSGHISQIWINPENSSEVLVAAQGPLWNSGGDRGLYKTSDGGKSWTQLLKIDADTGVNEFVVDPRNTDVIVASSYQRRRHVWVLIDGGPGSGIHKTTDGGASWKRIISDPLAVPVGETGLPKDHMGRIGLAGAASEPDTIYAIIEANDEEKGVYRSTNFGSTWSKRSSHITTSPQYYNEIVVDPKNPQRLYSLDTFTNVSEDGGKTFSPISNQWRHVDDHALWIDPENTKHLYIGGDGGIYESWDRGTTWRHIRNLSIAQFYRIQPDNDLPFYNVCGGTQDNNSFCAPSRTTVVHGVTNSDWINVLGGDGYEPQFDPDDPNIIYAQYQYGGLNRYDRRTRERVAITPQPASGEDNYKWNWNTPLLVSPHNGKRLYYAAEYLFRSDDRGNSWKIISPDLTRQIDRNQLKVMGRVWGIDTIAKNDSTSIYGSAIGISESPLHEGLLFIGTDDGLINITEDGGKNWQRVSKFADVPDMSYVADVLASSHDTNVVYAVLDNHKRGDFKPYVVKSSNRGKSWTSINGDLPTRGSTHTIVEDHLDPNLLFVGTEFGLFVTQDGGASWSQMKTNFPTIAVRDLEIQTRENDLVVGTFGRGVYILDDYTALRTKESSLGDAALFPVRDAWIYIEGDLWDSEEKGSMGASFFTAPNPPFGAVMTYYLKDGARSRKAIRRATEIEREKSGGDTPYPAWEEVITEDQERQPAVFLMIRDAQGNLVRQVTGETKKGLHRTAWDLRLPPPDPISIDPEAYRPPWERPPTGPMALPGEYSARLAIQIDGVLQEVGPEQRFTLKSLEASPEITDDRHALQAFQLKVANLQRAVAGSKEALAAVDVRIAHVEVALVETPTANATERADLREIITRRDAINILLNGNSSFSSRNEPAPLSISSRVSTMYQNLVFSQSPVADLYQESFEVAATEFAQTLAALRRLDSDLHSLEKALDLKGAPWTPGRIPEWSDD